MKKNKLLVLGLVALCTTTSFLLSSCKNNEKENVNDNDNDNNNNNDNDNDNNNNNDDNDNSNTVGGITYKSEIITEPSVVSDDYYESVRGLKGSALLSALTTLTTSKHTIKQVSYNGLSTYYPVSDPDLYDSSKMVGYYTGTPFKFDGDFKGRINREHVWCQSFLGDYEDSYAGSDIYNVHPSEKDINNTRGDLYYDFVTDGTTATETDMGGTPRNTESKYSSVAFDPNNAYRGDAARSIFYVATRYASLGYTVGETASKTDKVFGKLSTLLEWNNEYAPSYNELYRNNATDDIQGNRNPFIDHPEFATMIWDSTYNGAGALEDTSLSVGKRLTSVSVSGTLTKTTYTAGDEFDPTGLTFTANYSDNTKVTLSNSIVRFVNSSDYTGNLGEGCTKVYAYYCGQRVSISGITTEKSTVKYDLVTSTDSLVAGMNFILGCKDCNVVASSFQTKYFTSAAATFGTNSIVTVPASAMIFTLEGSSGAWKLKTSDGQYVGASDNKNLTLTGTGSTWSISFESNNVKILNVTESYGYIQYNSGSPRFLNYTSGQKQIQMYKVSTNN